MENEIIKLVSVVTETNDIGDSVEVPSTKEVFAKIKSVGMKEKYEALAVGLKPEMVFEISDYLDYDGEEQIEHEGNTYKVIRTYRKTDDRLEIVVTR